LKKLAIITTHPIQYNAPLFRLLNERNVVQIKVFYTWGQSKGEVFDPGFGKERQWDIPLLDGYEYEFVSNISSDPGSHHFNGIINPELIQKIEVYAPDALLVFGWSFKSHLKAIRHFKGKKMIIFRGDSNLLDESPGFSFKKIARRIFLTWIYRYVDVALYTGVANKAYYLRYGLKESQLLFAPHAVDIKRFTTTASGNKNIAEHKRAVMGIPADAIVFIFAGKFESKKNPQLLIDAFAKLKDEEAHLLLVGEGILELPLKANVALMEEQVRNRIHFMPFQNQSGMPDIYSLGDVFCLPSQGPGETWGLAVNEAMACSKPILVSNKCGCYLDLVKDEVNGFVVKSNDLNDWYQKMSILLEKKKQLTDMGRQSLRIIQQWSYENICTAIENVLSGEFGNH
jgi:glycosyltransferase involved in cell wall biosynthesis